MKTKIRTTLVTVLFMAALATPVLAGQGPQIRVTHSATQADQPDIAIDSNGNIHIAYSDNYNTDLREIWYTMLDANGNTLVDDTRITPNDNYDSTRPAIVVDSDDKIHILWRDQRWDDNSVQDATYTKLDPYLDNMDGTPAISSTITLVDDTRLSNIGSWTISSVRMVPDSNDNLHIVWGDDDTAAIYYMKIDSNGNELIAESAIRYGTTDRSVLELAVDSNDNIHVAWPDSGDTSSDELYYMMLDGSDGSTIIDATVLTTDDGYHSKWPSIVLDAKDKVHIVWQDKRAEASSGTHELYYTKLDPSLDDQDGDAADAASITLVSVTPLTPDDGNKSRHPAIATDGRYIHVTWEEDDTDNIHYMVLDANGHIVVPNTALTTVGMAYPYNNWTMPYLDVEADGTAHVVWSDSRDGEREVYYTRYTHPLVKTVDDAAPVPGQPITYTLSVANTITTTTLTDAVVSDTLPANVTFAGPVTLDPPQDGATLASSAGDLPTLVSGLTLTAGQPITITFPVTIDLGTESQTITNTAALTSTQVPTPDTWSAIFAVPIANLSLTKSAAAMAVPGEAFSYTISFANADVGLIATNVVITDLVPMGQIDNLSYDSSGADITATPGVTYSWQVEDLSPGEGGVITITGIVDSGLVPGSFISNTAVITTSDPDSDPSNNSNQAGAIVLQPNAWPTLVANTGLTLPLGAKDTIATANLQVTDPENSPDAVTYTVQITPAHGKLLLNNTSLNAGDTFTQTAIDQNLLEYDHDGSPTQNDDFHFSASDQTISPTIRVSLDSAGSEGDSYSQDPAISANGRYVAFESDAANLVISDTNGYRDIFVHDRQTGQTTRVSVDSNGNQATDGHSSGPAISADGRYVAFESSASNLIAGDTNDEQDIFVHDRQTGQTTRVSVDSDGNQASDQSNSPAISADGRYVAFDSSAADMISSGANGQSHIFVHDRQTGQTVLVSVNSDGIQGIDDSETPAISADGRYVAFRSDASNLVSGDANNIRDIFVHDRQTGQTTLVSVDSDGVQGDDESEAPAISADGRYVAFESIAANLVADDTNAYADVFVHDRQTGQTTRVSLNSDGSQGNNASEDAAISAGGRYVAFESAASNLVDDDTNSITDIFIHDRQTGQTTRASLNAANIPGDSTSTDTAISGDGRYVAFESYADNLVGNDNNGQADIFVRDNGVVLGIFELNMLIPDVKLTKAADPIVAQPGDPVTYTITFANVGLAPAANVVITDVVPVGQVDNLAYSSSGAAITPTGSTTYTWNVQDLAPGEGGTITITGIVSPGLGPLTFISNTAVITTVGALENDSYNNRDTANVFIFVPPGWPALAANTGLTLPIGATNSITTTHLQITDTESGPDAVTYTLQTVPIHGALRLDLTTLNVGDTFTQTSIDQNHLEYSHDGSLTKDDEFWFIANDSAEGRIIRASINSTGAQATDGGSSSVAVSADGRYVAFESYAKNLVSGDTNNKPDIFVRDQQTGETTRVSVDSAGGEGDDASSVPALSADGRYVAFHSSATNLVGGDTNGATDVFVHDRQTGETTRVSVDSNGNEATDGSAYYPDLSADGRYVAFYSAASNLVDGDTNTTDDVFVHDRLTGQTTRISVDLDGNQGNDDSRAPSFSADGRYVAFRSEANNLVSGDSNGYADIFVHDRVTGQNTRVSINSDGSEGNNNSSSPAISDDGRYVAFDSSARNLVDGDTNVRTDIFVHDRQTGQTTRISVNSDGSEGDNYSYNPAISADGRYVVFESDAANLVGGDTNGYRDVFAHDRQTGQTTRVSVDMVGNEVTGGTSNAPAISAGGRYVAFDSEATNLVGGDTNGNRDIFVHDRGAVLDVFALRMLVPDVELNKTVHFPFVETGETLTYTIAFANVGYAVATDVAIRDFAPIGQVGNLTYTNSGAAITLTGAIVWSVQDLAPGEGGVITITGDVNSGLASNTYITNTAVISTLGHIEYDQDNNRSAVRALALLLDDAPTLVANTGRNVPVSFTVPINTARLQVTDAESGPDLLTYTLQTAPTHGSLLRDGVPLLVGDTFSQTAIDGGLLDYAHDGSPGNSDSFGFMANDTVVSPTTRVSVDSAGVQGNNDSYNPAISADGRYVAFRSNANTLVLSDTNSSPDIFVHDRQTGQTTRVSVDSAGAQVGDDSTTPALSADGRYVAFVSYATNLVISDTNSSYDIFVHDRQTGQTTRVSIDSAGVQGDDDSYSPAISGDGRYVAFESQAKNLVGDDTNSRTDIFVHDRQTGETTRVSVDSSGVQSNLDSFNSAISADGRYVAFESSASDLVSGDTNYDRDIFVHDRQTGQTTRVSIDSASVQSDSDSYNPAISVDGRYIAFESNATNLVSGDTNSRTDIFVHDQQTGETTRVSIDSGGAQGGNGSYDPAISAGGRYVVFKSGATNLVGGDTNSSEDIFVHDRQTGQTILVSVNSVGALSGFDSDDPAISANGRYIVFRSGAEDLVSNDNNGSYDIFVRDAGVVQGIFELTITHPDVRLVKTVTPAQALPGQPITYTLAFSNAGTLLALNVSITDTVPGDQVGDWDYTSSSGLAITLVSQISNTWLIEVENLSPGEGGVITITGVVTVPLASGLTFTNTAAITCTLDGDWDNNHSDAPVTVLNAPPVAVDDDGATFEETSLTLDVLDNDHDLNGGNLILTGVGDGMSGTTAISGSLMLPGAGGGLHGATAISGSLIIYTPTLDFNGSDSFTYTVEDSGGLSDVGLVNVTVTNTNDAPVAVDDSYVTAFETRLDVPVELGVLDNDSDIDGDSLTAVLDSPPVGALAPNPDGSFIYTPTVGFTGVDTFTYHAYDGQASSHVATVTIIVSSTVNNAPLAVNDSYDVIYETALTVLAGDGVLYNDFDADDDPLTATLDSSPVGALAFDPDGSFIYTSTNGFTGTDTFTYHAYDGLTDSNVATVTLNVTNTVIDHLIYLPLVLKE